MKEGHDFVTKPLKRVHVVRSVKRALEKQELILENRDLRAKLETMKGSATFVGSTLPVRQLMDMVSQVAPSTATVLLSGESGTGKEVLARHIHRSSNRANRPSCLELRSHTREV